MRKVSLALLLLCASGAWSAGQPWTPEDVWNWRTPRDPRISPDGHQVVYLEDWNDRTANARCANLWLVSTDGKAPRRLTDGAWLDGAPRWSPDGARIAWISGRGGIHVLAPDSGQESTIEAAPLALAWSPDGRSLAFTAQIPAESAAPAWAPAAILPFLLPRAPVRTALYTVDASGGAPQALTDADFEPVGEPAWMHDGKSILTAASDGQIYAIRVADRTRRALTHDSNRNESPVPSPEGSKIAWMATDSALHSYSIRKLYVMNADGSHVKLLAGALDRDPVAPQWSNEGRTVYFLADDAGSTHIYAARNDSTVRQVTHAVERLRGFTLAGNGRGATVRFTAAGPELVTLAVDLPPSPEQVLAAPMASVTAARETAATEEIRFESAGKSVQAWLTKPLGFDAAKSYPLLLDIADAPRRMLGPDLSLRAQIFAANGWMVLRVNPRGTPGYGEEFGRLLPTRYPGDDAGDLLAAVDFVVSKGSVGAKRIAVNGGLLTAWLIGHTDRFAAAVARRPIVDFALVGTRAAPWMGALPWDDPEQYVKHSPIYFAQSWKTPTLVLAAGADPQADEFFAALEQRKVKAALVRLPDSGKPSARVEELDTTLAWLSSVLKFSPAPADK